ncbi:restriction endonuclease subunit S [Tenacibaculum finnmarkense]|uniref:restriction endonuclease subunit S n=1 Tax=Tenacibaculum finnmarkense TaxID=2781243 RepID=UPI001EFA4A05|nr:restriction endonuclease subunit S [Tenacibaculum finnmarkense]
MMISSFVSFVLWVIGTSAIYDGEDDDFIYPDIMMKIQVNEKIDNSYMNYVLSSSKIRTYYKDNATGTAGNMPKINQVVVSNTPICYPPKEEQTEIVKRVENLFSKADAIEKQYKTLKEKIDRLPQAILAKAFKGELVAQLPTDGDAKDLLEEIKKLKESLVVKPKKKVVRNKK